VLMITTMSRGGAALRPHRDDDQRPGRPHRRGAGRPPLARPRRRLELSANATYLKCRQRVLEFLYEATASSRRLNITIVMFVSSCPRLSRASTPCLVKNQDVDGRNKSGHDVERTTRKAVGSAPSPPLCHRRAAEHPMRRARVEAVVSLGNSSSAKNPCAMIS